MSRLFLEMVILGILILVLYPVFLGMNKQTLINKIVERATIC